MQGPGLTFEEGFLVLPVHRLPAIPPEVTGIFVLLKSGEGDQAALQAILVDCAISIPVVDAIRARLSESHIVRHRPDFIAVEPGKRVENATMDDRSAMILKTADLSQRLQPRVWT